jgi:CheY-like chemotaxis protein
MHALIVEPQAFTACDIEDALREIGYTSFAFATTTEEAVASAEAHRPDLVTCAVNLASGCGIQAAEAIGADKPVPVVFITHADKAVRRRVPEAPVVRKQPFRVDELSEAVATARTQRIRLGEGRAEAR